MSIIFLKKTISQIQWNGNNFFYYFSFNILIYSFLEEVVKKDAFEIQKEVPIKSSKTFLFEYWNVFFYLYSKKVIELFKKKNEKEYSQSLLDTLSFDDLFKKDESSISYQGQNNETNEIKFINKENNTLGQENFNSNMNSVSPNMNLVQSQEQLKGPTFHPQNSIGINSGYLFNNMGRVLPNTQNDLLINPMPRIAVPSINTFYHEPRKVISNPLQNESDIIGEINPIKAPNMSFFNLPIQSPAPLQRIQSQLVPSNNVVSSSLHNNYIISTKSSSPSTQKKPKTQLFNIKAAIEEQSDIKNQLSSRKRKRYIKNNKLVFVQLDQAEKKNNEKTGSLEEKTEEINQQNHEENEELFDSQKENLSELLPKNTKPRGSKYRGVSRNGSQWQVLIMVNKKKRYVGSFSNEEEAARAYDKVALQHHGTKAKTNYDYSKEEVDAILASPHLLKLD